MYFLSLFSNFSSTFDILLFKLTISTFPSSEFIVVTKVLEIELLLYLYNFYNGFIEGFMICDCSHSPFQYNTSEHVVTGDLNIIQHER